MNKKIFLIIVSLSIILSIGFIQESFSQSIVPEWIKNILKWYSDGKVSEQEFLNAIKFLIENKILIISDKEVDIKNSNDNTQDVKVTQTQISVSKPRINQCIVIYPGYQELGILEFKTKYSHINYLDTCMALYKDSIWKYNGTDRIEKLYERFIELDEQFKKNKPKLTSDPRILVLSTINVGTEKYLIKFNVCAGDKTLDKAKILIKSEIEAVQIGTNKDIPANTCRTYETQINAKHTANIQTSIIEQVLG